METSYRSIQLLHIFGRNAILSPFEYIKRKVDVRITDKTVEIFYNHTRIASHPRLYGRKGQYDTVVEHMPVDHQKYLEWNGKRFREWAERIGTNTHKAVDAILVSKAIEQHFVRNIDVKAGTNNLVAMPAHWLMQF